MSWFRIFSNLSQELNRLPDSIFSERFIKIGDFHSSWNKNDQSLQIIDENTGLFLSSVVKILVYFRPVIAINMEEIKLMIEDED